MDFTQKLTLDGFWVESSPCHGLHSTDGDAVVDVVWWVSSPPPPLPPDDVLSTPVENRMMRIRTMRMMTTTLINRMVILMFFQNILRWTLLAVFLNEADCNREAENYADMGCFQQCIHFQMICEPVTGNIVMISILDSLVHLWVTSALLCVFSFITKEKNGRFYPVWGKMLFRNQVRGSSRWCPMPVNALVKLLWCSPTWHTAIIPITIQVLGGSTWHQTHLGRRLSINGEEHSWQ